MPRFNLDSIVSKCVHRPIASNDADKLPLYKRNDGIFDENNSNGTSRSPEWMSAVERTYNSPNNVRRVFITSTGVYVTYWRQFKGLVELTKFYPYNRVNEKFDPSMLAHSNDQASIYKTGLGSLRGRWTCSNLEEVYFDWTVLLSSDLVQLGLGGLLQTMTSTGTTKVCPGDVLMTIFSNACLNKGEQISRVFPRLRVIGYVSMLDKVLGAYKPKAGEESAKDLMTPWYKNPVMGAAIKNPAVYVAIYKVPNVSAANAKFITRSFYCFDEEVLVPHFEYLKGKLVKEMSERRKGSQPDSDFKKLLADIEDKNGLDSARKMFKMLIDMPSSNKEEMLASLSEEDRIKYGGSR